MSKLYLTDAAIKRLPVPVHGQADYWDTQVKGFGLRISSGGARTFVINRDKRRLKLGNYDPEYGLSLAQARDEALRLKFLTDNPSRISFAAARDLFFTHHLDTLKETTAREQKKLMQRFPFSKSLASVSLEDVNRVLKAMPRGSARSCFNVIRTFFNWCIANNYLQASPLKKSPYRVVHRYRLLTDDEVRAIWIESFHHGTWGRVVRCLVLSGQRLNQFCSFDQAWIKGSTIEFPPNVMKHNGYHVIPLTTNLRQHLPVLEKPFTSVSDGMKRMRSRLSLEHHVAHDYRRYHSSTAARLRTPMDVEEAILAHTAGSRSQVQRIYDRFDRLPLMQEAMERFEHHLFTSVLAGTNSGGYTR
jgi:integrase